MSRSKNRSTIHLFRQMHKQNRTLVVVTQDLALGGRADREIRLEHGHILYAQDRTFQRFNLALQWIPITRRVA